MVRIRQPDAIAEQHRTLSLLGLNYWVFAHRLCGG